MTAPFDLERFVSAQAAVYSQVVSELRAGRKQSHWMWFVFPQVAGLGHSAMAQHYAIGSHAEADAYIDHPVLGSRLRESTRLVNSIENRKIGEILGTPDDMKFRSSMTLFAHVATWPEFPDALAKFYPAGPDPRTLSILAQWDLPS